MEPEDIILLLFAFGLIAVAVFLGFQVGWL